MSISKLTFLMMNLKNYILEAKRRFLGRVVAQFFNVGASHKPFVMT